GARPRQKQCPHLAQIIVQDRLAARAALLLKQLAQPLARQPRLGAQQPMNLIAKRIELRRPQRAPIPRRLRRAQRAPERVTAVTGAANDLLDRQPLHENASGGSPPTAPPRPQPPPHSMSNDRARLTTTPDDAAAPPRGQLSTGVSRSVLNRRRQL